MPCMGSTSATASPAAGLPEVPLVTIAADALRGGEQRGEHDRNQHEQLRGREQN
jgi:hypothetical protein